MKSCEIDVPNGEVGVGSHSNSNFYVLGLSSADFSPQLTGEEIVNGLDTFSSSLEAVVAKGDNIWDIYVSEQEVANRLEVSGCMIRGRQVELVSRDSEGTWVCARGLPLTESDELIRTFFQRYGEVVAGPIHVYWRQTKVKTGDRTLKMILNKHIPDKLIYRLGTPVFIKYRGQLESYSLCHEESHKDTACSYAYLRLDGAVQTPCSSSSSFAANIHDSKQENYVKTEEQENTASNTTNVYHKPGLVNDEQLEVDKIKHELVEFQRLVKEAKIKPREVVSVKTKPTKKTVVISIHESSE